MTAPITYQYLVIDFTEQGPNPKTLRGKIVRAASPLGALQTALETIEDKGTETKAGILEIFDETLRLFRTHTILGPILNAETGTDLQHIQDREESTLVLDINQRTITIQTTHRGEREEAGGKGIINPKTLLAHEFIVTKPETP